MYKQLKKLNTTEIRQDMILKDGNMYIPSDEDNKDWQEYQAWLALGNTPQAAD